MPRLIHPAAWPAVSQAHTWQNAYLATLKELHQARQRIAELETEIRRRHEADLEFWQKQKERATAALEKNRQPDPKRQAQAAVNSAVALGLLPRVTTQNCADCGEPARHYHHESYDEAEWLNVIPLCRRCHFDRHTGKNSD